MSHQQQQDAAAGNANGSSGRQSAASSVLEPKTYIDPSADTVLRSNDGGRDFRVNSYMLKANSDKLREMLAANPAGPITINTSRKALKLFLDLIHGVPLPGRLVWSARDQLFPLLEELECKIGMQRALSLCLDCPERDPWGMFVAASKNNYTPLARVALWELAREEMIMMEMEMGTHARGHLHAHVHVAHDMAEGHAGRMPVPMGMEFNSPFASMPSRPDSFSLVRSSTAVSPPLLRRLTAANLEGVSAPFVVGLLNAIMSAATDGVPLSWTAVAARFEPVIADERPPTKKERKEMMMAEHGFGAHSHSPSHVHQHHQALGSPGAGLGLNLHHQQGSFIHMGNKGGKMGGKKPMGGGMHPQLVKA